ncbi:protein of unknown function [Pararobbsia alpina]
MRCIGGVLVRHIVCSRSGGNGRAHDMCSGRRGERGKRPRPGPDPRARWWSGTPDYSHPYDPAVTRESLFQVCEAARPNEVQA